MFLELWESLLVCACVHVCVVHTHTQRHIQTHKKILSLTLKTLSIIWSVGMETHLTYQKWWKVTFKVLLLFWTILGIITNNCCHVKVKGQWGIILSWWYQRAEFVNLSGLRSAQIFGKCYFVCEREGTFLDEIITLELNDWITTCG